MDRYRTENAPRGRFLFDDVEATTRIELVIAVLQYASYAS